MLTIAEKLRAFSHRPGVSCLIPGAPWSVTGYPTRIAISHIETGESHFWDLQLTGPVEKFTVEQDLEKGKVFIFGTAAEGYFNYAIYTGSGEIICEHRRGVGPACSPYRADVTPWKKPPMRLSLGITKKPDWDLVKRREDLREILPLWFALGQSLPATATPFDKGAFLGHFRAHFTDILVPRGLDPLYQGIALEKRAPLSLLSDGARAIASLFVTLKGNHLSLLPDLPKEFHAGRLLGIELTETLTLDLEWSKKRLRQALFHAKVPITLTLTLAGGLHSFRVAKSSLRPASEPLQLDPGTTLLDRFNK